MVKKRCFFGRIEPSSFIEIVLLLQQRFIIMQSAIKGEPATLEQAQEMGLRPEEFDQIKEILGRTPNFTEMCIYSVMWSVLCSY